MNGICAIPTDKGAAASKFASFGIAHVKFWELGRLAPSLSARRGAFGFGGAPRSVISAAVISEPNHAQKTVLLETAFFTLHH